MATLDASLRLLVADRLGVEVDAARTLRLTLRAGTSALHVYDEDPDRLVEALRNAADAVERALGDAG